jgi:hypothetical protein
LIFFCGDFAELFESGFEVFDNFLGENVRIKEIVGFFEALSLSPMTPRRALSRLMGSS